MNWNDMSIEDRVSLFKYNYPFDYMLTPEIFNSEAKKNWNEFPQVMKDKLSWMIQEWDRLDKH